MKWVISTTASIIVFLVGGVDYSLYALFLTMGIDFLLGFFGAIINKNLNSEKMRAGAIHKLTTIIVVIFGVVLDRLCGTFPFVRNICVYYYIINESLSIIENIGKCGVNYPQKLKDILYQLKERK